MKTKEKLCLASITTILVVILISSVASASDVQNVTPTNCTPISAPWLTSPGLNTEVQGLYHLPLDHQWHSGPTYNVDDFKEWHYFTFRGKDLTTGHNVSLFLLNQFQGYRMDLKRPDIVIITAWADTDTGKFYAHTIIPTGKFVTTGSKEDFNYSDNDVDKGLGFVTTYDYSKERWEFKGWATNNSTMVAGTPYNVDVTGVVKKPGYVPMAYWGLENIGYNKNYDQNPETMYGLSYYYTAPEMEMTGNVTLDDGIVHKIKGTAWFEHQWGNFQSPEQARYFWGYARLPNGDTMTWRQYYGNPGGELNVTIPFNATAANLGWTDPHIEQSRFAYIPQGQPPRYYFGPEFLFTPIKWWTSPESNVTYPWYGKMKTPKGTFYLSPDPQPAQESIGPSGAFIEGAMALRKNSIDGPVVARGFCELVQIPALGPKYSRGLPERAAPGNIHFGGGLKPSSWQKN